EVGPGIDGLGLPLAEGGGNAQAEQGRDEDEAFHGDCSGGPGQYTSRPIPGRARPPGGRRLSLRSPAVLRARMSATAHCSGTRATALHQPALAPWILTGRQEKWKPCGRGSWSRLASFSIWQYSRSIPAKWAGQTKRPSPVRW